MRAKTKHFVHRVNLDSMQSETGLLLKQLNDAAKKVSNSVDEVKEQYSKILEVRHPKPKLSTSCLHFFFIQQLDHILMGQLALYCRKT